MLDRLRAFKQEQRWDEVGRTLDEQFQRLVGQPSEMILDLSETELLALLMQAGPSQALRDRIFLLVRLLQEAGDAANATGREVQAREYHLRGLHLLLNAVRQGESSESAALVPKVEALRLALNGAPLPARTRVMLMQHYEQSGDFAHAEDELHALLESDPSDAALNSLGLEFYRRLLAHDDAALIAGNLPRSEVEDGFRLLEQRRSRSGTSAE